MVGQCVCVGRSVGGVGQCVCWGGGGVGQCVSSLPTPGAASPAGPGCSERPPRRGSDGLPHPSLRPQTAHAEKNRTTGGEIAPCSPVPPHQPAELPRGGQALQPPLPSLFPSFPPSFPPSSLFPSSPFSPPRPPPNPSSAPIVQ